MRLSLFKLHREVSDPKSIVISRKAGRWYVSFNFEDANLPATLPREEILEKLARLDEHQLQKLVWAGDRGVRDILHGSDEKVFNFDAWIRALPTNFTFSCSGMSVLLEKSPPFKAGRVSTPICHVKQLPTLPLMFNDYLLFLE